MAQPTIEDIVPQLSGEDHDGQKVDLTGYRGSKVVRNLYPKGDATGCAAEACSLRDADSELLRAGYVAIDKGPYAVVQHKKFATRNEFLFRLLTDTDRAVADPYRVSGPRKFMGREEDGILSTTFLNDRKQCIERFISDVRTKEHTAQVLGR
jgi:peroxiredoxin Q/BCP